MSTLTAGPATRERSLFVWLALLTVYIAWGSTYVAIRVMDRTIPPYIGASVRFLLAGGCLYVILVARERRLVGMRWRELGSVTLVAALLLAGGNGLITAAERQLPAGITALLAASIPLWMVLLSAVGAERPGRATIGGLTLGFIGVALLVLHGGLNGNLGAELVVLAATASWALGSFAAGRLPMPEASISTAVQMLIGGLLLAVAGSADGEHWHALTSASTDSLLAILYLAAIGSIVAFSAYVWLLRHASLTLISTYAYVNPVVAVILGAILLGEVVSPLSMIGGAITIAAVVAVIRDRGPTH